MTELPVSNACPSSFAGLVIPIASQPPPDKPPAPTILYSWREIHPNAQFHYIRQHEEANNALERLEFGVYGFDIEWKPTFRKGQPENPVSLIQIANHEVILLLQVSAMREFPSKLHEFLVNPNFGKAGAGIQGDTKKLYKDCRADVRNCVDLSLLARTVDNAEWKGRYNDPLGLARMTAAYKDRKLVKGKITRSNWENLLTEPQQEYAANDAHAGYVIYMRLMSMMPSLVTQPHARCYSFDSVRGRLCDLSGSTWQPSNPNYDPGPPPPPREPKPLQSLPKNENTGRHNFTISTVGQSPDTGFALSFQQPSSSLQGATQQGISKEPRGNNFTMHLQPSLSQMPTQVNSRLFRVSKRSKTSSSQPAELRRRESNNP
ncbi:hypothetical protein AGABI1DRAFT_32248 [Agaricus bisporus var. burnettii JB137-S8]|uniref:3'-5' exonuclease n=1 Tax=Agaricus bisporus var. burnettii (strain JB137-S8 / ATCC MYA-4627 / FGSC 10392) TaxID=597362 RepID=K5Y5Q7_AGABU|nr:uncharacterized protein AGABI1DRAFT_32248 [Agaricus bisporus var. burnettii JB137-S8]EKM83455.1 hypothetical protein AGABI1DRAFT_32248 [Agaricus bisporus var. burnettii JB137-S8]